MMKKLLLFVCLFTATLVANAQEATERTLQLVSDNIEIPVGKQYRMYINEYSEAIYQYMQNNPRIAVEFTSDDSQIVESGGAWFRGKNEGTTTMHMEIYGAVNAWGDPDYSQKLDEATFTVTVKNAVAVPIPKLNTSWGISREEMITKATEEYGYDNYKETYFNMNPGATANEMAMFEIFKTDMFEFPLVFSVFNDEDQMWAYQFMIVNYERAWNQNDIYDAALVKILQNNGYTLYGTDEQGRPALYNPTTLTNVTFDNFIVQGQFMMYCTLEYEEENPLDPNAIQNVSGNIPTVEINTVGTTVEINTDSYEGESVELYNTSGQLVGKTIVKGGKASVDANQHMPVIVKMGKTKSVKVML